MGEGGASEGSTADEFGALPLPPSARLWGFGDFVWVTVGLAIATWAFLGGAATADLVGFGDGVLAMIVGNAIGVAVVLLAAAIPCQRHGVEQYTLLRATFGPRGASLLVLTFVLIGQVGWAALLAVMFGRAAAEVGRAAVGASFAGDGAATALALVALALAGAMFAGGPRTIRGFNRVVSPALVVLTLGMGALLWLGTRWEALLAATPSAPTAHGAAFDFMLAVELNIGVGLSWWPVIGNLARLTTGPRVAFWGAFLGLFVGTVLAQVVGLAAALTLGSADPTHWMIPLGGLGLGVAALMFVAVANLTSLTSIAYCTCLALRHASAALARARWRRLGALYLLAAAALCFTPTLLYDHFLRFVTWLAAILAALCGTVIADSFLVRRQQVDLPELAAARPGGAYHGWRGFQLAGFVSAGLGALVYVAVYDPMSQAHAPLFLWASASVPAFATAAVVHVILARSKLNTIA